MGNLRDGFGKLAQELATAAEERKRFVARNRRETQQLRERNRRLQAQVVRDISRQAQSVAQMLETSTNNMRRQVSRMMTQNRSRRLRTATETAMERRQIVSRIRRQVSGSLELHRNDRARNARQQIRIAKSTQQSIRRRVAELRTQSVRLTGSIANDLASGRQALAAARRSVSNQVRPTSRAIPMMIMSSPTEVATPV